MSEQFYRQPEFQPFTIAAGSAQAMLIHGFLGTPREMRPLAQELAAHGVTASGILLPGFGPDVGRLKQVRAEDWLAAARAEWSRIRRESDRAILIGFSMGGAVALAIAGEPDLAPDRLVLLAPHWRFADSRARLLPIARHVVREFKPFSAGDLANPDVRQIFAAIAPDADLDDPETRRALVKNATIPTAALDELRRIGHLAARASRNIAAPSLVIQGIEDTTSRPAYSRQLAERIRATLVEVPAGHMLVDPEQPSWPAVRDAVLEQSIW